MFKTQAKVGMRVTVARQGRRPSSTPAHLLGTTGTVAKVGRTRVTVAVDGTGREWSIPFEELFPVREEPEAEKVPEATKITPEQALTIARIFHRIEQRRASATAGALTEAETAQARKATVARASVESERIGKMSEATELHAQEIHLRIPAGVTDEVSRALYDEVCRLATVAALTLRLRFTVGMTRSAADPMGPETFLTPEVEEANKDA